MSTFSFALIGFGVVAVAIIAYTASTRRQYLLESLPLVPGETELFVDESASVSWLPWRHALVQSFFFQRCVTRVTNRRIVVGVRALFQPAKKVVTVIAWHSPEPIPEVGSGADLLGGQAYRLRLGDSRVEVMKGGKHVAKLFVDREEPRNSPYPPVYLLIASERLEEYRALLKLPADAGPFSQ
jgi:hypothetical protein